MDDAERKAIEDTKREIENQGKPAAGQETPAPTQPQVDHIKKPEVDFDDIPRCPICSGFEGHSFNFVVLPHGNHMVSCTCGLLSRPFNSRIELLCWWKSRGGRMIEVPKVSVKHNPTKTMAGKPEVF